MCFSSVLLLRGGVGLEGDAFVTAAADRLSPLRVGACCTTANVGLRGTLGLNLLSE